MEESTIFDGSVHQDTVGTIAKMLKTNRALPSVPPPAWGVMDSKVLFGAQDNTTRSNAAGRRDSADGANHLRIDIDALKHHLLKEGRLKVDDALTIVNDTATLLAQEPNLLQLPEPVVVVGDIHGQFFDLVKLLELGGDPGGPQQTQYLFLGDYVDRGCFSCECVLLLFSLKLCYPSQVFLLRGNHEARHLTTYFNFKAECIYKYGKDFYTAVMAAFDSLPIAAMVGGRYFCVHGGLSPDVMHVEDIAQIYRFREIPNSGAMCDLLWSDPHTDADSPGSGGTASFSGGGGYFETEPLFTANEARNCSYLFNFACLYHFISTNQLLCVVRAHEAQDEGFKLYRSHPNTHFPSMLSIFSAPNYCDTYDNKGAIAVIGGPGNGLNLRQFFSSPHPYVLPNFMNAFKWSGPFIQEKLMDALSAILGDDEEDEDDDENDHPPPAGSQQGWQTKEKIRALAGIAKGLK